MDRRVGDADRAHQAELGLHEQILEHVFGDRRQRLLEAEHAAAMAHGVELEIRECNLLHLAVGRVVLDPVLVAALAIARMQHRRMLVGDRRKLVETPTGQSPQPLELRREAGARIGVEIHRQQLAQARIDAEEIHPAAVGRDELRGGRPGRRLGFLRRQRGCGDGHHGLRSGGIFPYI